MVEIILIIVIIVIILKFLGKINVGVANKEKSSTIETNNNGLLQARDSLNLHLNAIYETYLEMKRNGYAEKMISITLFPTIGRIDNSRIAVGISIQFDGTWFWPYIKNDFIPSLYEVGMYEDFREWKSVGGETGTWDSVGKRIAAFVSEYKTNNATQGEFLNLIKVQLISSRR